MADSDTKPPESGNRSVQLGIGTLIIIAIIVSTCSGQGDVKRVQADTADIKQQISEINRKLDAMASQGSAAPAAGGTAAAPAGSTTAPPAKP